MLSDLAAQESPAREISEQTMNEIVAYMKHQFDPIRFVVRERYKSWSEMQGKPVETIPELAARIRHDSATYAFATPWTKHFARILFVLWIKRLS